MPWTFCGSVIATAEGVVRRTRTGSRTTRSSTGSGISFVASAIDARDGEVDERQAVLLGQLRAPSRVDAREACADEPRARCRLSVGRGVAVRVLSFSFCQTVSDVRLSRRRSPKAPP